MTTAQIRQRLEQAHIPVGTMTGILIMRETDLDDERAVVLCLTDAGFKYGDVLAGMDAAIEAARCTQEAA